ncbi:hypothetical protein [Thalassoglobus sp.]|uniref:hypothetical protein n=1 Tax=Thalassoglobus sp. TaxID=2795869 RepID=UPI003AA7AE44
MEDITAYHESGHAFTAMALGAIVHSLSIDPDWDDGPERYGDVEIEWQRGEYNRKEFFEKRVLVALGGPVAEMIYTGDPFHPAIVPEWKVDWENAWQNAAQLQTSKQKRMVYLEQKSVELHRILSRTENWSALAVIADNLLAHEILERDHLEEILADWDGAMR